MGIADSLKGIYDSIEEAYYGFAEGLQNAGVPFMDFFVTPIESRGVPSLPVFVLLFVALAAGALLLLTSQVGAVGTRSLAVTVQSAGQGLDGVDVQVLLGDSLIAKAVTKNGKVSFEGLPASALSVRISKSGFKTLTLKSPAGQASLKAELKSTPPGTEDVQPGSIDYSQLAILVLDADTEKPLSDAQVLYVSDEGSGQKSTDAQGQVVVPKSSLTNLRVSKSGYKTETLAVRDGGLTTVYLKPLGGSFFGTDDTSTGGSAGSGTDGGSGTDLSLMGAVTIQLNASTGPVDGHVRLYSSDGTLVGESDTVSGLAAFSAPLGSQVFVMAQVQGFALYDGSARAQAVTENTLFLITLDGPDAVNALDTVIRASDAAGNALTFSARIIKPPLLELASYTGERWELEVLPGSYYVFIDSDGYLSKTAELQAGSDNAFTLEKATPFNSAALTVKVRDEFDAAISGARVFLLQNERLAAATQETDFSGSAVFNELSLTTYNVTVVYGRWNVFRPLLIPQGGTEAYFMLPIHRAVLHVRTLSALDDSALSGASVKLDAQGQRLADVQTAADGSASFFDVPAKADLHLAIGKEGFVPFIADLVLADDEGRELSAVMVPKDATQGAKVDVVQIRQLDGTRVGQLRTGESYVLELNATPAASAANQSIYLRVGSQSDMESDDAYIAEYSSSDSLLRSTSYAPSVDCADLAADRVSSPDGYKWVELRFTQPASRIVSFLIHVKAEARSNQKLSLFFATWTQNRTLSARDPPKEPAASCYPETYKYDVPIVRGNTGQATPTPTPSGTPQPTVLPPTGGFTPSVDIRYNPSTGKVESDVQEITLQADSIYPRDSVPLRITDDAPCAIESRLEAKQPDCFSLSRTSLTFQSNEYAGGCPAKVKGNQLDVPQGDAYLVLGAICSPTSQIRIPIRVNAQSATSITAAPRQLDEGEGTAKLLYVINQKQSGARTLTPLGASGTVAVGAHSASVFSWSGPGTLSLLDGDVDVGEWTYQNAPAYFEGVGSMGPRVDSASDYLGCSQGWCSGQAALQALRAFQQAAKDTAAATMFRRGSSTNLPPAQPTPVPTTIPSATPTPSATASASPSASPSPSASATASATPSPSPSASAQASSTSVSMKENDVRTAANGNKIKLTEILDAGGTTYAAFSVLSSSGADLDAPSLLVGESYNKNGIQFQVTSIDPSSAGNQRAVHVTLTGSWQLAASSVIGLDGLQASSETSFSPRALSFATVAGEPFVFSTVMQLTEGADKAFDILGVQRTGSGCGGLPGVYLVTASSTDGSTFAYSAQALRLQQSLDGTKPDLLLCGFMHASKKQVVALKNPSLPSQLQASEEHAKPQTKLAIFTLAPVYKQQCEALGNQVVTLQKKIDAEKADLRQAANLLQAAVTQLDAGIKVAFAAEAGSKGAKSFSEANAKVAPYVCTKAGCTPCAIRGCAPGYADATGPNGQALAAHGSARLNLFNAKTALSEALAKANLPDEATSSAVPSPVAASTGPATQAAEKLNKEFTTDIGAVETSRQSAVEALQAAKPPATDKGSGAAVGAAAKSSGLATTAQTKTAAALTLAKGAAQAVTTVRLQYDKDVQQLTATKQKCNAMRPPLFEIPFGLWPQQSQFACPTSDRYAAEAARLEAEKLATQNALDVATKSGADFGADLDTKIADAKALAAKGCVALCKPKPACIESYPMGRQFTQVIHLGLSEDCMPYSKNAAGDLAKSFLVSKVMSSLGPYAMLASFSTGGACSGAQGYFTTDNLGGQGGGYSGGNVGGGGFIG